METLSIVFWDIDYGVHDVNSYIIKNAEDVAEVEKKFLKIINEEISKWGREGLTENNTGGIYEKKRRVEHC